MTRGSFLRRELRESSTDGLSHISTSAGGGGGFSSSLGVIVRLLLGITGRSDEVDIRLTDGPSVPLGSYRGRYVSDTLTSRQRLEPILQIFKSPGETSTLLFRVALVIGVALG